MMVCDGRAQRCYVGGISGYNTVTGSVADIDVDANIMAFAVLANDANGMGWVDGIHPTAYVYSGGIVGFSQNQLITYKTNNASGEVSVRHYAPQYVFLYGAGYDTSTKSYTDNIKADGKATYNE